MKTWQDLYFNSAIFQLHASGLKIPKCRPVATAPTSSFCPAAEGNKTHCYRHDPVSVLMTDFVMATGVTEVTETRQCGGKEGQ
jgi:hypothetical protein